MIEYDKMTNAELDRLAAEKVMDIDVFAFDNGWAYYCDAERICLIPWNPICKSDGNQEYQIVDKMIEDGWDFQLCYGADEWYAEFEKNLDIYSAENTNRSIAVVIAALKAAGG